MCVFVRGRVRVGQYLHSCIHSISLHFLSLLPSLPLSLPPFHPPIFPSIHPSFLPSSLPHPHSLLHSLLFLPDIQEFCCHQDIARQGLSFSHGRCHRIQVGTLCVFMCVSVRVCLVCVYVCACEVCVCVCMCVYVGVCEVYVCLVCESLCAALYCTALYCTALHYTICPLNFLFICLVICLPFFNIKSKICSYF